MNSLQVAVAGLAPARRERGGQAACLEVHSVVRALPPRLLATAIRWSPALPVDLSRRWGDAPTWMVGWLALMLVMAVTGREATRASCRCSR